MTRTPFARRFRRHLSPLPALFVLGVFSTGLAQFHFAQAQAKPVSAPTSAMPPLHRWVKLGQPSLPSLLQVPPQCSRTNPCPLVVISHPRAQDAARMRDSARVGAISHALLAANFAVLLSNDGGVNTWGSPNALRQVGEIHKDATKRFAWNRRTYAFGISMGGLMSLRSALPGAPYRVEGVALMDAWLNLRSAWGSAESRRKEINVAYGQQGAPGPQVDPLPLALRSTPLPLFVVSSPDDTVVAAKHNADLLVPRAAVGVSESIKLKGPHLGGNRFTPENISRLVGFFQKLEKRAKARQGQDLPAVPLVMPAANEFLDRIRRILGRAA